MDTKRGPEANENLNLEDKLQAILDQIKADPQCNTPESVINFLNRYDTGTDQELKKAINQLFKLFKYPNIPNDLSQNHPDLVAAFRKAYEREAVEKNDTVDKVGDQTKKEVEKALELESNPKTDHQSRQKNKLEEIIDALITKEAKEPKTPEYHHQRQKLINALLIKIKSAKSIEDAIPNLEGAIIAFAKRINQYDNLATGLLEKNSISFIIGRILLEFGIDQKLLNQISPNNPPVNFFTPLNYNVGLNLVLTNKQQETELQRLRELAQSVNYLFNSYAPINENTIPNFDSPEEKELFTLLLRIKAIRNPQTDYKELAIEIKKTLDLSKNNKESLTKEIRSYSLNMTGLELELRYQNEFKDIIDALSKQLNAINNLSDQQKQELVAGIISEFSKLLKNPIYSELVNLPNNEITNLAGICNKYLSDPKQTNSTALYAFLEQLGPALPFGSITNIYTSWWRPVAQAQKNKLPPTAISNIRRTGLKDLGLAIITDAVKAPFVTSLGLTGIGAPVALVISAIVNPASAYFKPTEEVPKNTRTVLEMLVRIMKHRGIMISSDLQTTINPPTQKETNGSNDPTQKPPDSEVTKWVNDLTGLVELLRTGKKVWDNFKKKTP